jgi:cob(I)alamin adenosyltransferase
MKIYTRTGDQGETALFGGRRVRKDSLRVEAYGTVDELNATLGAARAFVRDPDLDAILAVIQNDLFVLGADLATPLTGEAHGKAPSQVPRTAPEHVAGLEDAIDRVEAGLDPLRTFILPAGAPGAGLLHLTRAVCRRAERRVVALARRESINPQSVAYLNRLSDLLFVLARLENQRAGVPDVPWRPSQT